MKTYIKELDITIEKAIHHKGKSYNDLVEEFGKEYLEEHVPTYSQLQYLRNKKEYIELLELDNTWEFVKQEDLISKENGYVARFNADSDGADLDCNWGPPNWVSGLGVRFVWLGKEIKENDND